MQCLKDKDDLRSSLNFMQCLKDRDFLRSSLNCTLTQLSKGNHYFFPRFQSISYSRFDFAFSSIFQSLKPKTRDNVENIWLGFLKSPFRFQLRLSIRKFSYGTIHSYSLVSFQNFPRFQLGFFPLLMMLYLYIANSNSCFKGFCSIHFCVSFYFQF